jgi:eukaryotic-like serine/threonine-protein kinase
VPVVSDLPPPRPIADRYHLTSELGRGGMGRVWAARDDLLGREVAIKELVPPPGLSPHERNELRERAVREARAIARIDHPNVVPHLRRRRPTTATRGS